MTIKLKRAYQPPAPEDGKRYLVDRLWPRGVKKEDLQIEAWLKDLAPSDQLRKWSHHDPERWPEFQRRYREELKNKGDLLNTLRAEAKRGTITLVYAARDEEHNNAVVLRDILNRK